ncbi:MAG: BamA/TamA family outer membrane protein [Hyphomonadaceae bacterium]|nr:BamA/TamA family outer membrane protein [Hyphomonadaceae bacterium]
MIKPAAFSAFAMACAVLPAAAENVRITSETAAPGMLANLRAELTESTAPDTVFEARRQARRAAEKAENYLNSLGYFAPEISFAVEPGPPPIGRVRIEPGPRFILSGVTVNTGEQALSLEADQALQQVQTLKVGDDAIPKAIVAEEAGLIAALKAVGYAETEALPRNLIGDRVEGTLDLTYNLLPGPRIRLGEVIYSEGTRTRRVYLNRLIPYQSEELYSPQTLAAFTRRLNATRLYRFSSVQLADEPSLITAEGDEVRDVIVQLEERDRYTLTSGASFSTSEGPGLTGSLTRRNATRRGDTITGAMTLATLERSFAVDWRIPNVTAFDRTLVLSSDIGREETDAFDREAITLSGAYEVRASRRLSYALGIASEFTREEDAFEQRDQQILSTSLGVRLDHANDPLDATRGWRVDTRGEPGIVIGDREAQYFSLNGQVSAYRPITEEERFVLAGRVRSGFVFGAALADLPVSRRFFAGGGGSARGFEYQSVGPQDADGTPTGGRGLLEVSGELRWRRDGPLGFVGFLDGASVSADQGVRFDDVRYSAGLGVRYDTLIGPIRFDLATPIDPRDGDDPVQVYVSIGQAF